MGAKLTTSEPLLDVVRRHLERSADGVGEIEYGPPVRRFIDELSASTRSRVTTMNPGNFLPGESMSKGAVWDSRSLERGINHRTVVGPPRNFSPDDRQYCRWLSGLGADIRWNPDCATRMILVDGTVALLRAQPADAASDAIIVTNVGLLALCQGLFDATWSASRALEDGFTAEPANDEVDLELLRLLADGATDAQVARALDMSPRQVGRRIARLGAELGAVGRFALGAAAQRRGWL